MNRLRETSSVVMNAEARRARMAARPAKRKHATLPTGAHRGIRLTCTHWDYGSLSYFAPSWPLTRSLTHAEQLERMLLDARQANVPHPAALAQTWRDYPGSGRACGSNNTLQEPESPGEGHPKGQRHQRFPSVLVAVQMARLATLGFSAPCARLTAAPAPGRLSYVMLE